MLVIGMVMLLVVGPKDLPRMLRTIGKYVGQLKSMARDFQRQFEDAARDTGLDDVRQGLSKVKDLSPTNQVSKAFSSMTDEAKAVKDTVEKPLKAEPAATETAAANGAAQTAASEPAAPKKKAPAKRKPKPKAKTKTAASTTAPSES